MRYFLILCCFLAACQAQEQKTEKQPSSQTQQTKEYAQHFFDTFAKRTDWQGFLDLYADSMKFSDVLLEKELDGRSAFEEFYNWPDTNFRKHPDYPQTLVVEKLIAENQTAIATGYFTPFYYYDVLYDSEKHPMSFLMILEFEDGKIIKQTDWVKYPPSMLKGIVESQLETEK